MNEFLYEFAKLLKKLHDFIERKSNHMDDKVLHFLVLGFTGLLIFALTYPMFKRLDKKNDSIAMAAVYTIATTAILTISMAFVLDVSEELIGVPFIIGFTIFIFSYQIFKVLDRNEQAFRMTNYFTTTIIICFAIAIEVCQGRTKTGNMEVADALFGIAGYIVMYAIMYIIITIFKLIFRHNDSEQKLFRLVP